MLALANWQEGWKAENPFTQEARTSSARAIQVTGDTDRNTRPTEQALASLQEHGATSLRIGQGILRGISTYVR